MSVDKINIFFKKKCLNQANLKTTAQRFFYFAVELVRCSTFMNIIKQSINISVFYIHQNRVIHGIHRGAVQVYILILVFMI